jgi:hypothetical protein
MAMSTDPAFASEHDGKIENEHLSAICRNIRSPMSTVPTAWSLRHGCLKFDRVSIIVEQKSPSSANKLQTNNSKCGRLANASSTKSSPLCTCPPLAMNRKLFGFFVHESLERKKIISGIVDEIHRLWAILSVRPDTAVAFQRVEPSALS